MDIHAATEQAYRNGYEAGYEAGAPKWIPMAERLPENGQQVLRYHGMAWNPKITLVFYYKNDEQLYGWCDVTHWKPLPNAPTK